MVLVPGPGVAAIVARALGGGFWSAVPMVIGILFGDLVYLGFAIFGLAAIAEFFGPVFVVVLGQRDVSALHRVAVLDGQARLRAARTARGPSLAGGRCWRASHSRSVIPRPSCSIWRCCLPSLPLDRPIGFCRLC